MKKYIVFFILFLFSCFKNTDNVNDSAYISRKNEDSIKQKEIKSVSDTIDRMEITLDSFYLDRTKVFIYQKWASRLDYNGHIENYLYSKYDTLDVCKYLKDRGDDGDSNIIFTPDNKYNTNNVKLIIWLDGSCGRNSPYLIMRIKIQNKLFKVTELYEFDPETKTKTYFRK